VAASAGFNVTKDECVAIMQAFKDATALRSNGMKVATEKYFVIKADDRSVYGKKQATGVVVVKTTKALLIGTYDDKIQPGNCANVVEKLADYLIEQGY